MLVARIGDAHLFQKVGRQVRDLGHDVVSVSLNESDLAAAQAALASLRGLERIVAERDALALYVEDGAGSIVEIVRRLEAERMSVGAISVARPSLDDVFLQATGRRLEGATNDEQEVQS